MHDRLIQRMLGRTPGTIETLKSDEGWVIADFEISNNAQILIEKVERKLVPQGCDCRPVGITAVEKRR